MSAKPLRKPPIFKERPGDADQVRAKRDPLKVAAKEAVSAWDQGDDEAMKRAIANIRIALEDC